MATKPDPEQEPEAHDTPRRRADDLPPAGQRTGKGASSLLPFLAQWLALRRSPGPPDGVERRAPKRRDPE